MLKLGRYQPPKIQSSHLKKFHCVEKRFNHYPRSNVHFPCCHENQINENASVRSRDISCGERDAGSEAKARRRAENRKGWLGGSCLDLVVLVRSLRLPLAKIKVIVLTTLVYDNTRRQFSKRIIFRSFHEASAKHEKQHEFTLQNLWLFLPGDYPLTTDTEVKKLDFYAISASKARVLILIG